jgi:uncharacterized LabA/DUF88 family protein/cold shock CspA family protein
MSNIYKIGFFYDGNFVNKISDFYNFRHISKSRISLKGIQEYVLSKIVKNENVDSKICKIVESHIYKSRTTARAADEKDALYGERVFDDACMYDGITTHYLPVKIQNNRRIEKGTDVWLALDAYEISLLKKLDMVVLVTNDIGFKPLVKKLHSIGVNVLLLSWEIDWNSESDYFIAKSAKDLIESCNSHIDLANEYEVNQEDFKNMIVQKVEKDSKDTYQSANKFANKSNKFFDTRTFDDDVEVEYDSEKRLESEIHSIKNGYGFITYPPNNIFFHAKDLLERSFDNIEVGDAVEFQVYKKPDGDIVAKHVKVLLSGDYSSVNNFSYE